MRKLKKLVLGAWCVVLSAVGFSTFAEAESRLGQDQTIVVTGDITCEEIYAHEELIVEGTLTLNGDDKVDGVEGRPRASAGALALGTDITLGAPTCEGTPLCTALVSVDGVSTCGHKITLTEYGTLRSRSGRWFGLDIFADPTEGCAINDSETSKTVYSVKVGNGHQEGFSVGTVTFDTTGSIKGKVLVAGGDFVESQVGTGSAIHYRYGRNLYSTYADDKARDGEGNPLFEARVGILPETGSDADDAGPLCKRREHAFVSVRSVDETVTLLKDWTPGLDVTLYAKLAVANGAQITLDEARLTEFGGELDAKTAFTDGCVERGGDGPYTYAAREEVQPDFIRTSTGEFVLNFQLPANETLTPQKVAEIAAREGVKVIGFQPPRGLLVRMTEPNGLNAVGKVENVRRAPIPEFGEESETVTVDVFPWGADLVESVGAKIEDIGGTVVSNFVGGSFGSWGRIRATLPRGKVAELAAVGDVRRIRRPLRVELLNNVSRQVVVDGSVLGFYCRGAFAPNAGDEVQQRNDLVKSVKPGLRRGMGRNLDEVAAYANDSEAVRTWLGSNGIAADKFANSGYGAASFLLGLQKILVNEAKAKIAAFTVEDGTLLVTFEINEGDDEGVVATQTAALSAAQEAYVKSIVRCAEDLELKTEIEAEKTASVDEGGKSLTVVIESPKDKAAAFVRIVIPSVME